MVYSKIGIVVDVGRPHCLQIGLFYTPWAEFGRMAAWNNLWKPIDYTIIYRNCGLDSVRLVLVVVQVSNDRNF